ncbi:YheC/YheD family protein [Anaerobacillus sp. CMMVII]|uniref:YheC/YheD family endospore coat-associated protein n=1 Tax=Anaerobacillus sp. CMMVII TaxID=2755588 RepID=UPI0021B84C6B|nr:YheC/YheD family protein [Anaerobacillus sp. CMMVII]MCT8139480.1 YheC/YheD family protein [Anaerobacillus sp. CMMVII]
MVSLGILVTNLQQEEDYFTTMAKVGLSENVDVFLFLPTDLDPINKRVRGKKFCHETSSWQVDSFSLPLFIYDRCFYENEEIFKHNYPNVSWLKAQPDVTFLGHGLPNKWLVHNALINDPLIGHFLPDTELLIQANSAFSMFQRHSSLLLKPVSGSQGKGIFILTDLDNSYLLTAKKNGESFQKILSKKQVEQLLNKISAKRKYLIQPFLQLTNNEERPFDLRVFLQRDKFGQWMEIGRGIRTGKIGEYTSNLGSGGEISSYAEWLQMLPLDAWQPLQQDIATLIERIPKVLENHGQQLFEIGFDFGFDHNGKLWLLEVNSKPGRKVITTCFPQKKRNSSKSTNPLLSLFRSTKKRVRALEIR